MKYQFFLSAFHFQNERFLFNVFQFTDHHGMVSGKKLLEGPEAVEKLREIFLKNGINKSLNPEDEYGTDSTFKDTKLDSLLTKLIYLK